MIVGEINEQTDQDFISMMALSLAIARYMEKSVVATYDKYEAIRSKGVTRMRWRRAISIICLFRAEGCCEESSQTEN